MLVIITTSEHIGPSMEMRRSLAGSMETLLLPSAEHRTKYPTADAVRLPKGDEIDRDLACGSTAHEDVRYFPIGREELISAGNEIENVGCGHTLDHPDFEQVFEPIFESALRYLVGEMIETGRPKNGSVATAVISIARARYTIEVVAAEDWFNFSVAGICLFEQIDPDLLERTSRYLEEQLILRCAIVAAGCISTQGFRLAGSGPYPGYGVVIGPRGAFGEFRGARLRRSSIAEIGVFVRLDEAAEPADVSEERMSCQFIIAWTVSRPVARAKSAFTFRRSY